ncbi:hypothetical protein ACVBEQ_08640 [Nakamurella sp. GG22]
MPAVPWRPGRGKLGALDPLLGDWEAQASSPMGALRCSRTFARTLNRTYVQLTARWVFTGPADGASRRPPYEETVLFGVRDRTLACWSFTSDGKHSEGVQVDVADIDPSAIGFQFEMPAGIARQAYWPADDGVQWVVEARNARGWKRFTQHHYRPVAGPITPWR